MADRFLRVAVPAPLSRLFDYRQPATGPVEPGCRVSVPFGRRHATGLVMETAAETSVPAGKLRAAKEQLDAEPLLGRRRSLAYSLYQRLLPPSHRRSRGRGPARSTYATAGHSSRPGNASNSHRRVAKQTSTPSANGHRNKPPSSKRSSMPIAVASKSWTRSYPAGGDRARRWSKKAWSARSRFVTIMKTTGWAASKRLQARY